MKTILLTLLLLISAIYTRAQITLPYSQDFEGVTFPPTGWQLFSGTSGANWVRNTAVSGYGSGTACTGFDNFNTAAGNYYGIRLPSMNFTGVTMPYVRFQVAYAQRPSANSDNFTWYWSNNGSSNWVPLQGYSGSNLASAPATSSLFVPAPTEWRTITLSLASLAGKSFVRLAIEDVCMNGNMLYFDNVTVFDSATTGIDMHDANPVQVYPHPFTSFINIDCGAKQNISKAELFNATGALVATVRKNNSVFRMENLSDLPVGIYFIKIHAGNGEVMHKKLLKLE